MHSEQINRVSGKLLLALTLVAFFTVLTGFFQAPQPDEGTAAHIFQLSVVMTFAVGVLFLVTADWHHPRHTARFLAFPIAALLLAFAALYYLEHFYYPARYR
jgi:uncharacterized membrane protein